MNVNANPTALGPGLRPRSALLGFALLLALVFTGALAAGHAAGPLTPGPRPAGGGPGPTDGGMDGMPGMDGMDHTAGMPGSRAGAGR
ncbi:hypothetical protein ACWCYY_20280 [Kitasatospora sp. NPDC001664]